MRHLVSGATICSCFMHFFCCVVPFLMTLSGVFSLWGTGLQTLEHPEWMENLEPYLPFISGMLLAVTGYLTFAPDAREATACGCPVRAKKSNRGLRVVFYVSFILFTINTIVSLMYSH